MRAAIIESPGGEAKLGSFSAPQDAIVGRLVAAPINPVDHVIAQGTMPFRRPEGRTVLGLEGVAERANGSLHYFFAPRLPYGAFAELVPLSDAETVPVPAGLDPVSASALGVSGIAALLSLQSGGIVPGASVLILGATGSVGAIATQAALALGARSVVGTARNAQGLAGIEAFGAQAVGVSDPAAFDAALGAAQPNGFDIVIDLLWGVPLQVAVGHLAFGARVVQVGNSADASSTISAPVFRNRGARLIGHSNFLASAEERASAYRQAAELAAVGKISVHPLAVPFAQFETAWNTPASGKTVLTF